MIGRLQGKIMAVEDDAIILNVNGVGYEVFCPARTLTRFGIGEAAEFVIDTHFRQEEGISLYGFETGEERRWFRKLLSIQGIGMKAALLVLGAYAPEQLSVILASEDKTALTRIPGIGPKIAARLVTELRDWAGKTAMAAPAATVKSIKGAKEKASGGDASQDAVSALVNLGYGQSEAFVAVRQAKEVLGEKAPLQELIRKALGAFAA